MDKQPKKMDSVPGASNFEEESMMVQEDISQQDQNAQLFIEALLQASQNQLLTESALLAMNQLWMSGRGSLPLSQGNIQLGGAGNISLVGPGHGNTAHGGHGNMSVGSHGNEQLGNHSNISHVRQVSNVQDGQHNSVQNVKVDLSQSKQISTPHVKQATKLESHSQPVKDIHIIKALGTPVSLSEENVKETKVGTKVNNISVVQGTRVTNTVDSDYILIDTNVHQATGPVQTTTANLSEVTHPVMMDTNEPNNVSSDGVDLPPAKTASTKDSVSPGPAAASAKRKSRRETSSTSSHMSESGAEPRGAAVKGQPGSDKTTENSSRAGTPRRRGSQVSEGGRRSRPQSECEIDMTPDSSALMAAYTSDDLRRQMTGSVTPDTDVGFQPSMLDAVLTEKKLALLRSPEVRRFLHQQQVQRAKERKLTHSSRAGSSKGDNSN